MPNKLPRGWVEATLGEINAPSRSRVLPQESPDLPYIGMEHVEAQTMRLLGHGKASDVKSSSVRFATGDVLYGKMRPYLNKVWLAKFNGLCSAEFLVFPQTEGLNNHLFAYRLNADDFVAFANHQVSGDRPRVDFEKLAAFPYLLPPANEQERILAKLDALVSRVTAGEVALRRALERLVRYRAAVQHAAVTGELSRAWRDAHRKNKVKAETGAALVQRLLAARRFRWEEAELRRLRAKGKRPQDDKWKSRYPEPVLADIDGLPQLPDEWAIASFDQITTLITKGASPKWQGFDYRAKGIVFVRSEAVRWGSLDLSHVAHLPATFNKKERKSILEEGDVLLNLVGASIGRAAVATRAVHGGNVNQAVAIIRLIEKETMNQFAVLWLISSIAQKRIHSAKVDFARANFSLENTRSLPIPIPSLAEQAEIVGEVERRLSAAEELTEALKHQLDRARATRQSLMRKAFAGRLVPQDPNDEPAYSLLDRIRAARETEAQKRKIKPMPKSKSKIERRPLLDVLRKHKKPMTPEELFRAARYGEESVDRFFAELKTLTTKPARITEERTKTGRSLLKATS